jgi:hypothetical protein
VGGWGLLWWWSGEGGGEDGAAGRAGRAAAVWVGCRFVSAAAGRGGQGRVGLTLELCISDSCTMGDIWSSRSDGAMVLGGDDDWELVVLRSC